MLQNKTVHDMCYRMYAAWMYLSCLFSFWRIKRKNRTREKQQHIYSTTNQPGTSSFLFWLAKTYYACWLILKNGKGKLIKENSTQHVNYCTRERLEVLRQCKSIAPIQIMHSMGNGNGVCWCRAHGLKLPPDWWKWSVRVGANLQGAGNKQGTNGGHSCGGKGPIVRPSTLTLFRYSKDGHCAIFSCVSPRCCRHWRASDKFHTCTRLCPPDRGSSCGE